jgi:hypothetical protein
MWSQQSNFSWQAPIPGNLAPQFHDHSCFYPHQQYQEEPPSPKQSTLEETMAALKEASARLDKSMSAFLSQAEEDRQSLERTNNSNMQSFERMDAHFKQIMDILQEEKCQGQLAANHNEYYMEDECTYYHEQAVKLRSDEVVENQMDERKE